MSVGISRNQTITGNATAAASLTMTFNNVKAGSLLILNIVTYTSGSAVSTVSDGVNTWAKVDAVVFSAAAKNIEFWYATNVTAGSPAVVITPVATDGIGAIGREYAGATTLDTHVILNGNTTSLTSGPAAISTNTYGGLVIGYCGQAAGANFTVGAGFTNLTNFNPSGTTFMALEDQLITSPTVSTATFTGSGTTEGTGVATFLLSSAASLPNKGLRPHPFSPGLAR